MRINGSIFDPLRPERTVAPAAKPVSPLTTDQTGQNGNTSAPTRSDSVQISDAGRSMASRAAADASTTFDPERVAQLRTKVLTGAYNTLDVVDQVARRIISRGDF
jgi:anti-sigma28 factor (negative regulator of flagellin synthesis)